MKKRGSQICFGFRWAQQWEERWALGALSDEKMRGGFWRVNCLEYKGLLTRPRWGYLGCQLHAVMLWASCSCWLLETMPVCRGAVWNKSPRSGAVPRVCILAQEQISGPTCYSHPQLSNAKKLYYTKWLPIYKNAKCCVFLQINFYSS